MNTHSTIRTADLCANKLAHPAANKEYYMVYIISADAVATPCLLTTNDISVGIERAANNKEDVVPLSLFAKIYNRIVGWLTYAQQ
jgi:hypothetical protein